MQVAQDAAKLAAAPLWPPADNAVTDRLTTAYRLEQAAAALQSRLVQHAKHRGLPAGHEPTAAWLRSRLRLDPGPARDLADRAAALARRPAAEQALIEGSVDARRATAITRWPSAAAVAPSRTATDHRDGAAGTIRTFDLRRRNKSIKTSGREPQRAVADLFHGLMPGLADARPRCVVLM